MAFPLGGRRGPGEQTGHAAWEVGGKAECSLERKGGGRVATGGALMTLNFE